MMFYRPLGGATNRQVIVPYAEDGDASSYPKVDPHFADLAFRSNAVINAMGWQVNPAPYKNPDYPGYDYYRLKGDVIQIINRSNPLVVDSTFEATVPHLYEKCDNFTPDRQFLDQWSGDYKVKVAHLDITHGLLYASQKPGNYPVVAFLDLDCDGAIEIFASSISGGKYLKLKITGDPIVISHLPETEPPNDCHHFRLYQRLSRTPTKCSICEEVTSGPPPNLSVGCSPTQFP